jgi:hypothetical protein
MILSSRPFLFAVSLSFTHKLEDPLVGGIRPTIPH